MDPLEQANRDVAEMLTARAALCSGGETFTGGQLLFFRQLPKIERDYYAALSAPIVDEHSYSRTVEVIAATEEHGLRLVYDPPYPEPCACEAPALHDYNVCWSRCAACLSVWPEDRVSRAGRGKASIGYPLRDPMNPLTHLIGVAMEKKKR